MFFEAFEEVRSADETVVYSSAGATGVRNNRMKQGSGVALDMTGEVGAEWTCISA